MAEKTEELQCRRRERFKPNGSDSGRERRVFIYIYKKIMSIFLKTDVKISMLTSILVSLTLIFFKSDVNIASLTSIFLKIILMTPS